SLESLALVYKGKHLRHQSPTGLRPSCGLDAAVSANLARAELFFQRGKTWLILLGTAALPSRHFRVSLVGGHSAHFFHWCGSSSRARTSFSRTTLLSDRGKRMIPQAVPSAVAARWGRSAVRGLRRVVRVAALATCTRAVPTTGLMNPVW